MRAAQTPVLPVAIPNPFALEKGGAPGGISLLQVCRNGSSAAYLSLAYFNGGAESSDNCICILMVWMFIKSIFEKKL